MVLGLSDRQIKILEAIVTDYIETAEPVGSRTIAKKAGLGVSSATIRNEMSDLEELGLIIQPHVSAGRAPTDLGYRLYVDSLMRGGDLADEGLELLRKVIVNNVSEIDYLMKETARAVAALTNYAAIAAAGVGDGSATVRHARLIPIDETTVGVTIVTGDKAIRNTVVNTDDSIKTEELDRLSAEIDKALSGLTAEDMEGRAFGKVVDGLEAAFPKRVGVIHEVIDKVRAIIKAERGGEIYTSGMNNLLSQPEFADVEMARSLFKALEERDMLVTFLGRGGGEDDIQIMIGGENDLAGMKNCSIIKARYKLSDGRAGAVGVLGPTRMDYPRVVAVLAAMVNNIKNAFGKTG